MDSPSVPFPFEDMVAQSGPKIKPEIA